MITVSGLYLYPLKGARGIAVDTFVLDRFGPRGDRRWMVVDPTGDLVTQREIPRLCLVSAVPTGDRLRLEAPGAAPLEVPIPSPDAPRRTVRVWDDHLTAQLAPPDAHAWLTELFGTACQLTFCPEDSDRRTDPDYDPIGGPVSFADGYPLLLAGEASLAELNRRLPEPLPMNRFRPNVVVRGSPPFAEDEWKRFRVGGVPFDVVKPCARCTVTTVDQQTADRGVEPLRTLATFRKRGSAVMFGMNVVHRAGGSIGLGDQVELASAP